jgi:hypothetical protein
VTCLFLPFIKGHSGPRYSYIIFGSLTSKTRCLDSPTSSTSGHELSVAITRKWSVCLRRLAGPSSQQPPRCNTSRNCCVTHRISSETCEPKPSTISSSTYLNHTWRGFTHWFWSAHKQSFWKPRSPKYQPRRRAAQRDRMPFLSWLKYNSSYPRRAT